MGKTGGVGPMRSPQSAVQLPSRRSAPEKKLDERRLVCNPIIIPCIPRLANFDMKLQQNYFAQSRRLCQQSAAIPLIYKLINGFSWCMCVCVCVHLKRKKWPAMCVFSVRVVEAPDKSIELSLDGS